MKAKHQLGRYKEEKAYIRRANEKFEQVKF